MKRKLTLTDLLIIAILLAASHGLAYAVTHSTPVQASGGPVARPAPTCDDAPKAGTVELRPNGTANAISLVEFSTPFCTGPVVVVATVNDGNTAGERVATQAFGLEGAAVSLQLGEASEVDYVVGWVAMVASQ
jgi:hypothetical protein